MKVAQRVERWYCKPKVAGSIPVFPDTITVCKSGAHLGSDNSLIHLKYGGLVEPQVKLRNKYK